MRPYSDLLPLRLTTVWGGFRVPKTLPHRYGHTGGELIQYDQQRTLFVWADHACESVDTVLVDGIEISSWAWHNGLDSTGRAVTFVEFSEPQAENAALVARGRGKQHPTTGVLLENPASVIWDILANVAGNTLTEATLQTFATECSALNIQVGGSVEETASLQSTVRSICDSVGAIFSPDARGLCRIHPGGTDGLIVETIDRRFDTTFAAGRSNLVTSLSLSFSFEAGSAKQSIKAQAPDAIALFGTFEQSKELHWVTSSRVAFAVAVRLLRAYSQPRWAIKSAGIKTPIRVGDTVNVSHPVCLQTGNAIVVNRTLNLPTSLTDCELEFTASSSTRVVLVQQSNAFAANEPSSAVLQTIGSERVVTITEETTGEPIGNAAVTLDGQVTRYTDTAGVVEFPVAIMPAGMHTLDILTVDGRELSMTVLV